MGTVPRQSQAVGKSCFADCRKFQLAKGPLCRVSKKNSWQRKLQSAKSQFPVVFSPCRSHGALTNIHGLKMTICIAEYRGTVHCFWMHICISFSFSHISLSKLHPMSIIARHLCSYLLLHFKVRQWIYQGILFSHDCTDYV